MAIRENKYARRAREREQNSKKVIQRDPQPTPEEQLARLEEDIRRLKVEFDIYFNGAARRPPYDTKGRVHAPTRRHARAAEDSRESAPSTFVCADARSDVETVKNLYGALVEAKKSCGESTDDLSFARFHRMVAEKSEALKERADCERVHFSVAVRDGRVQFKAKAEK